MIHDFILTIIQVYTLSCNSLPLPFLMSNSESARPLAVVCKVIRSLRPNASSCEHLFLSYHAIFTRALLFSKLVGFIDSVP